MLASGFAGLGYQIVWTQQCALWLGHESAAVLAVVAAFFGGLALGALALGTRIARSAQPARWYAGCELLIALWGLALMLLMRPFSEAALAGIGVQPSPAWHWFVAFSGTFVLLLPATAAMGATLPAMARVVQGLQARGQAVAGLYAANTAGAVVGVLATAFWLVPQWGLMRTAGLCVALNLGCAAVAFAALKQAMPRARTAQPNTSQSSAGLLARLAFTGLLGIGYEVLVVRVLSQVAEDTVYTFALLLAVYLLFTALGAAAYQRWGRPTAATGNQLLVALALACLAGTGSLWAAEGIKTLWLEGFRNGNSSGMLAALSAEAALAFAAFALPTFVMGALFSHLSRQAEEAGIGFAQALGVNTLGAAFAPLLFGVLLAPAIGPKFGLLLVALGYVLLVSPAGWRGKQAWLPALPVLPATAAAAATATATAAMAFAAPPLAFVDVPEGGRIVSYEDGAMAAVSVVEDAQGVARLRINNRQQEGSSATRLFDARQALIPLLLHPQPQRALFLGLGTGVTAAAAAEEPGLKVDAVELLPEVIAASKHFTPNTQARLLAADARRYVRATNQRYDVIVSDNFHPARSGSGSLYTVEHFNAVRDRLTISNGVFCQWLPLHQMDLATLQSIVHSFITAFPGGYAALATNSLQTPTLGLVGRADDGHFNPALLRQRAAQDGMQARLQPLGLADEFALLGSFVAGPASLAKFAAQAPANTDDRPVVAYRAPRLTYAPDTQPAERLLALLPQLQLAPADLLTPEADGIWNQRLAAYWQARSLFIASGRSVQPRADVQEMLQQVRGPLLAVLNVSADFRPAYDPLLRMALTLATSNPAGARSLLEALARAQPQRPEALQALQAWAQPPKAGNSAP